MSIKGSPMWDDFKKYLKAVFFQGWYWKDWVKENQTDLFIILGVILLVLILFYIRVPRAKTSTH
ncbi:unnamed protein product [marine sediment metagenome]|uniref:Uncharacterized protein n=1 Tax=marine sediment metagenome TaxID=412755 RepID=X1L946_9ZZZZ